MTLQAYSAAVIALVATIELHPGKVYPMEPDREEIAARWHPFPLSETDDYDSGTFPRVGRAIGAGNSVGDLGMAGGILALALLRGANLPIRLLAAFGIALGVLLLVQRNIHGAALLTGVAPGLMVVLRMRTPDSTNWDREGRRRRLARHYSDVQKD